MRVGIEFSAPGSNRGCTSVELGVRAEALGFDVCLVSGAPANREPSDVVTDLAAATHRMTIGIVVDAFCDASTLERAAACAADAAPGRVVLVTAAPASRFCRVDDVPVWIDGGGAAALSAAATSGSGWIACVHRVEDYALIAGRFDRMVTRRAVSTPASPPARAARFDVPRVLTTDELETLAWCGATTVVARIPLALTGVGQLHRIAEELVPYAHSLDFAPLGSTPSAPSSSPVSSWRVDRPVTQRQARTQIA
jgi:hypothetical protein